MSKKIEVRCTEGVLTCRNTDLKFTEQGIMLESPNEDVFIPYGALNLIRCKKGKGRSNIKLQKIKIDTGVQDCV